MLTFTATADDPDVSAIRLDVIPETGDSDGFDLESGVPFTVFVPSGTTTLILTVTADDVTSRKTCTFSVNTDASGDASLARINTSVGLARDGFQTSL